MSVSENQTVTKSKEVDSTRSESVNLSGSSEEFQNNRSKKTYSGEWRISESDEGIVEKFKGSRSIGVVYNAAKDKTYLALGQYAIETWEGNQIEMIQTCEGGEFIDCLAKAMMGFASMAVANLDKMVKQEEDK